MKKSTLRNLLLVFGLLALLTPTFFCTNFNSEKNVISQSPWRNVYDSNAHYVGIKTCATCHESIYKTFIQTGMGQSFDFATKAKSAADFSTAHALVYDKDNDFYYKPFWKNDSLYIMEYRIEGKDTVHKRIEQIQYIVGSGQHTNSHIFQSNHYFYQAPITYYTQKKKWDLAPGFEKGANSRFQRMIELECMSCHNGLPDFDLTSENKFISVKTGIDCERCHGPGSLHVAEKQAGKIVDTSKSPDYSIVNPRRLSVDLQNNLCERCHLQGITVLNDGKSFYDFHPGMQLSEVMNVFMPKYEGGQDKMIMASHVERMKESECFLKSGKMSCITCHNPHVSVKFTPITQYLNACQSCHNSNAKENKICTEKSNLRQQKNNDCVLCHMPQNGSIDIPHVAVTDHFIRKKPFDDINKNKITAFLGLQCINNSKTTAITKARAYLEFYERYNPNKGLIDSALMFLSRDTLNEKKLFNKDVIRAYFLLNNFNQSVASIPTIEPKLATDAWMCYRLGESYTALQNPQLAILWYERAIQILPHSLDFQNKYANCLVALNRSAEAEKTYLYILSENPNYTLANANIGYLYMQQNNVKALIYLTKTLALNPDHEQTMINLAVWYHNHGNWNQAEFYLQKLLKKNPKNETAFALLQDLKKNSTH